MAYLIVFFSQCSSANVIKSPDGPSLRDFIAQSNTSAISATQHAITPNNVPYIDANYTRVQNKKGMLLFKLTGQR